MKKGILSLLAALPALAIAQQAYTIKGKVGHIGAPAKVFLTYRSDGKTFTDSAAAVNGAFTLAGNVKDVTLATLVVDYKGVGLTNMDRKTKRDAASLYLSQGTINVNGPDSLSTAKVTGTKINADYAAYKAYMKPMNDKSAALNVWYNAASAETRKTKAFTDELDAKEDAMEKEQGELAKTYVKTHSDSYMSLTAMSSALGYYPEYSDAAAMFNSLSPALRATTAGKTFATRLDKLKLVALGATAPEFAQADANGKMVSLSSFRGKYLLVDFWASWCGPCRQENPNVVKAFNNYKDKNFTILGVSLDRPGDKQKWLDAVQKDGLNWTQVSDLKFWDNEVSKAYGIQAIPQNILIDPSGKIIAKGLRGDDLNNKLAELFGKI